MQATAAAGGCLLVARWRRGRIDAVWAAPLVAVLVRILLDPVTLGYYWLPAGVLVLAGAVLTPGATRRQLAVLAALAYLTLLGGAGVAVGGCSLAAIVAVLVFLRADPGVARVEGRSGVQDGSAPLAADVDLPVPGPEVVGRDRVAVATPHVGQRDAGLQRL